jgi:uncharacterized membrane protein YkvA (DUF1232 family)
VIKWRRLEFIKGFIRTIRFLRDRQVPFIKKLPALLWVIYLISPLDLLPDPVLGLGIIDDAVLLSLVMNYLNRESKGYRGGSSDGRIIDDVEYHVSEDDQSGVD